MSEGLQAEAIQVVAGLAQQAQTVNLAALPHPAEPPDVYSIYNQRTGEIVKDRITAEPKPILCRQVLNTAALVACAQAGTNGAIYYNKQGCVAIHTGADNRRYRVDLPLPFSEEFIQCRTLASNAYPQRQFWNLLRTTFADAVDESIIRIFKTLKWSDSGAVNSSVSVGKESLGKSVMADVSGEGSIPDTINMFITALDATQFRTKRYPLRCAVDTIIESRAFRLIPVANDLDIILDKAMIDLRSAIEFHLAGENEEIPIIYGNFPSN